MPGDIAIRVEGLGKKYVIGHSAERERYVALRDVIARNARNLGRTAMDLLRGRPNIAGDELEDFWALKDVGFEIRRGDVVGVIGRNGAGKSTLLKILSRITEPTEGRVEIHGRVASLLEVGTGFHPELTGRENVFLNGAILGMTHREIRRKFDEIVAFAEVDRFLDTPVKRYSSGMYVRLAFAVAAHLEPEILVVDEVLAVGDAEFQKKCLGKMGEVAGHGRTVLFVSHNMAAAQSLCTRGLLLDAGGLRLDGDISSVIATYIANPRTTDDPFDIVDIQPGLRLEGVKIEGPVVATGAPADFTFSFEATSKATIFNLVLYIYSNHGVRISAIDTISSGAFPFTFHHGSGLVSIHLDAIPYVEGEYSIGMWLQTDHTDSDFLDLMYFSVLPRRTGRVSSIPAQWRGLVEVDASACIRSTSGHGPTS